MAMQVILTQDVDNLGKAGELVSVKPGYGRNYLVPNGFAVSATVRNKNRLDHEKALIERKVAKERASANDLAIKINAMTLQFERVVGEDEKLFGSVTSRDIADQLGRPRMEVVQTGMYRPNLRYRVEHISSDDQRVAHVVDLVRSSRGTTP